jgi:DNA-binding GntR family transcriptional regulator
MSDNRTHAAQLHRPNAYSGVQVTAVTKTDMAYQQIRGDIIEGVLVPATELDQEALAQRLGLSTTPVREALRLLETEGLVVSRRHHRTMVAGLDASLLEETYAVRLALDPLAAQLAAINADDVQRELIREFGTHEAASNDDPVQALYANRRLHQAIYVASGNSVLTSVLDALWDRSDRYRLTILRDADRAQDARQEHAAILRAVLSGDGDRAAELTRVHVSESMASIRRVLGQTQTPDWCEG